MKNLILVIILFFLPLQPNSTADVNFQQKKFYYENLVTNWPKIFPDSNRNAAGPRFFKYLIDQNLTYQEFIEYNKLYCPVSGSLINPGQKPVFINVKNSKNNEQTCGNIYQCCLPCSCDLMNYVKVKTINHKFKDGKKKIDVLLIKNPCQKKDFPEEVNRNYFCKSNDLNKDEVFIVDNQLVVGLLHSANKCQAKDLSAISNNEMTGKFCAFKNQIPTDKLNMGMGDIFIKMAR